MAFPYTSHTLTPTKIPINNPLQLCTYWNNVDIMEHNAVTIYL
jgi:hypothetical protein